MEKTRLSKIIISEMNNGLCEIKFKLSDGAILLTDLALNVENKKIVISRLKTKNYRYNVKLYDKDNIFLETNKLKKRKIENIFNSENIDKLCILNRKGHMYNHDVIINDLENKPDVILNEHANNDKLQKILDLKSKSHYFNSEYITTKEISFLTTFKFQLMKRDIIQEFVTAASSYIFKEFIKEYSEYSFFKDVNISYSYIVDNKKEKIYNYLLDIKEDTLFSEFEQIKEVFDIAKTSYPELIDLKKTIETIYAAKSVKNLKQIIESSVFFTIAAEDPFFLTVKALLQKLSDSLIFMNINNVEKQSFENIKFKQLHSVDETKFVIFTSEEEKIKEYSNKDNSFYNINNANILDLIANSKIENEQIRFFNFKHINDENLLKELFHEFFINTNSLVAIQTNIYEKIKSKVLNNTAISINGNILDKDNKSNITYLYLAKTSKNNIMEIDLSKSINIEEVENIISQEKFSRNYILMNSIDFNHLNIEKELAKIDDNKKDFDLIKKNYKNVIEHDLLREMASFNIPYSKKAIPVSFYYDTKELVSVKDIVHNLPLKSFITRTPLGNTISNICKSLGIDFPSAKKSFSLWDKNKNDFNIINSGGKDKVTSYNLGAMKFSYLPKTIELNKEKDKDFFINFISEILTEEYELSKDLIKERIKEIKEYVDKSEYLMIKNLKKVNHLDSTLIMDEIFSFVDAQGNDLAKLSIPTATFYKYLEKKNIFDIKNYVEIDPLNATTLNKISNSLITYIENFKNDFIKTYNIDINEFNKYLHSIIPELVNNNTENSDFEDKIMIIAHKFKLDMYYKEFYFPLSTVKYIKQLKTDTTINENIKERIISFLEINFKNKELNALEKNKIIFLKTLKEKICEDNIQLYKIIENNLFKILKDKKTEKNNSIKTIKLFAINELMKNKINKIKELENTINKEELLKNYKDLFKINDVVFLKILKLKDFQYREALSFVSLSDKNKKEILQLFYEMRMGKTRTMATILLLNSMLDGKTKGKMFVQNKNKDDIVSQLIDMFPLLAKDIKVYGTSEKITNIKKERVIEIPINMITAYTPNLIGGLKKYISSSTDKDSLKADSEILINNYSKEMEQISSFIKNKSINQIKKQYELSPFIKILDFDTVDDKNEHFLKKTFIYIQKLYEQHYLDTNNVEEILNKIERYNLKYIDSFLQIKTLTEQEVGIDIISKNLLYSIDINSKESNIKPEKIISNKKISNKCHFSTYYDFDINIEKELEFSQHRFTSDLNDKNKIIETLVENNFVITEKIQRISNEKKIILVARKEEELKSYMKIIFNKYKESLKDEVKDIDKNEIDNLLEIVFNTILIKYINDNLELSESIYYDIKGIEITDSYKINLEKFDNKFITASLTKLNIEINEDLKVHVINYITNDSQIKRLTEFVNKNEYYEILYKYYNPLNPSIKSKVADISPEYKQELKNYSTNFSLFAKIKNNKLYFPPFKSTLDNKILFNIITCNKNNINFDDLKTYNKIDIANFEIEINNDEGKHLIIMNESEKYDFINKNKSRNNLLSTSYLISLKSKEFKFIALDEQHKGLATSRLKNENDLQLIDTVRYLANNAIFSKGSFVSSTGTPMAGIAKQISNNISLGLDYKNALNISSSLSQYCSVYSFKNILDSLILTYIQDNPNSLFNKLLAKELHDCESNIYDEVIFNKIKDYILTGINVKGLDYQNIKRDFTYYQYKNRVYGYIEKLKLKLNKGDNVDEKLEKFDLINYLFNKISHFATISPGISNYLTFSDILGDVKKGNNDKGRSTISLSRPNGVKYNVYDNLEILKAVEKGVFKITKEIETTDFNDKILGLELLVSKFSTALKLRKVKKRFSEIFEKFVIDLFSKKNISVAIKKLDLKLNPQLEEKEIQKYFNKMISKSSKTANDSITNIFVEHLNLQNINELRKKYDKEKVFFFEKVLPLYSNFINEYHSFKDKVFSYSLLVSKKKQEEFLFQDIFFEKPLMYTSLSSIIDKVIGKIAIIGSKKYKERKELITINLNEKGLINYNLEKIDITPKLSFELNINKWDFFNNGIKMPISLTNNEDKVLLELLAVENNIDLYTKHLNRDENIRLSTSRSILNTVGLLDSISSCVNRKNKDKKVIILINQSSVEHENKIQDLLKNIEFSIFKDNNIELKFTNNTTKFTSILEDLSANKENQLILIGNYKALAEGIDMSMIDTGFYIGEMSDSSAFIQSIARQRGNNKEVSSFYLANNAAIYKFDNTKFKINDEADLNKLNKIFSQVFKIENNYKENKELENIKNLEVKVLYSNLVKKAYQEIKKIDAYGAVMSGEIPLTETIDFKKKSVATISKTLKHIQKEELKIEEENNKTLESKEENIVKI